MLLQLSQVKRKLAGRSANVLPKQAGHDSVLRPQSKARGLSPAVAVPHTGLQATSRPLSHQRDAQSAAVILLCHIPAPAAAVPDKNHVQVQSSNIWDLNYCSYSKRSQPGVSVLLQVGWADASVEK